MDSVGDLESAFDIVGGVFKSVDQRDGFAIGAGVASTGLSGLAGDCRCVRAGAGNISPDLSNKIFASINTLSRIVNIQILLKLSNRRP